MSDGSRHAIYYIEEVTPGVTPANPEWLPLCITGTTLGLSKTTTVSEKIKSNRQVSDSRHGVKQVGGDISFELAYGQHDPLIAAVLGNDWEEDAPQVGTDRVKAGVARRTFSILRHFTDQASGDKPYLLYTGVEMNTLALTLSPDARITGTFGVLGRDMSDPSTTAPAGSTYAAEIANPTYDTYSATLTEGGAASEIITELTLSLENGLEPRFRIGSDTSATPQIGRSNLTGQVTAFYEDSTLLEKFINETESDLVIELPDRDGNEYKITIPRIVYNGGQPDVSGPTDVPLVLPFQSMEVDASNPNITWERTPV